MKCLFQILFVYIAFSYARPQVAFLVPVGHGANPQHPPQQQLLVFHDTLGPLFFRLQEQHAVNQHAPFPFPFPVPAHAPFSTNVNAGEIVPVQLAAAPAEVIPTPIQETAVFAGGNAAPAEAAVVPVEEAVVPVEENVVPVEVIATQADRAAEEAVVPVEEAVVAVEEAVVPVEVTATQFEGAAVPVEVTATQAKGTEGIVTPTENILNMIPAEEINSLAAESLSPAPEIITPVADTIGPIVEPAITEIEGPAANLIDPQFHSFFFHGDTPAISAAKRAHFAAFTTVLRRNSASPLSPPIAEKIITIALLPEAGNVNEAGASLNMNYAIVPQEPVPSEVGAA